MTFKMITSHKPHEEFSLVIDPEVEPGNHLVVFNDDVNTFDFVIESLIEVCNHDRIQAEQCTFLIHFKGKCSVKDGEFTKLRPMCEALLDRGITAEIE
jgi:ATP-dependent Clp protease adaptor protein ClpS